MGYTRLHEPLLSQCVDCKGKTWICRKPAYRGKFNGRCKPTNPAHINKWHSLCPNGCATQLQPRNVVWRRTELDSWFEKFKRLGVKHSPTYGAVRVKEVERDFAKTLFDAEYEVSKLTNKGYNVISIVKEREQYVKRKELMTETELRFELSKFNRKLESLRKTYDLFEEPIKENRPDLPVWLTEDVNKFLYPYFIIDSRRGYNSCSNPNPWRGHKKDDPNSNLKFFYRTCRAWGSLQKRALVRGKPERIHPLYVAYQEADARDPNTFRYRLKVKRDCENVSKAVQRYTEYTQSNNTDLHTKWEKYAESHQQKFKRKYFYTQAELEHLCEVLASSW